MNIQGPLFAATIAGTILSLPLGAAFSQTATEDAAREIRIDAADKDGDGRLSEPEVAADTAAAFVAQDEDGDGVLSKKELDEVDPEDFAEVDGNGDGKLTIEEAEAYRKKRKQPNDRKPGVKRDFAVNPGWDKDRFPDDAVCYLPPEDIAKIYGSVTSRPKPDDGSLRIAGTGHSFMATLQSANGS